jgi:hypothetical protein
VSKELGFVILIQNWHEYVGSPRKPSANLKSIIFFNVLHHRRDELKPHIREFIQGRAELLGSAEHSLGANEYCNI